MTKNKMIACTLSALAFTVFGASAHALTVSGAGFVPASSADAPSIIYAQGAVTSTDASSNRQVIADMGFANVINNTLSFTVRFVGNNNGAEECTMYTRDTTSGVANSFTFSRPGLGGPNTLTNNFTNVPNGNLAVSLRCGFPPFFNHGQIYILYATVSQTSH